MNTVYINGEPVGQCTSTQIRPTVAHGSLPEYDVELIEFVYDQHQPQLDENQNIKTNSNLLKINDLAFELQHDDELTKEQWDKVEQIYKLSLPTQLNENQQNLIIWMQENECYNGDPLESISDLFLEGTPSEHFPDLPLSCVEAAYQSLNNQQKIEMVSEYLQQYSEQEG